MEQGQKIEAWTNRHGWAIAEVVKVNAMTVHVRLQRDGNIISRRPHQVKAQ